MNTFDHLFIHNQHICQKQINKEFSRIITAAVINKTFRMQLLKNPVKTIQAGYRNESFLLSTQELNRIQSIKAATLEEFAAKLTVSESNIMSNVPIAIGNQ